MNKAKFRNLRIFLAYVFMILGISSVIFQWHFGFSLVFTCMIWLINYQNFLKYSYNLEFLNHFLGHIIIGLMMDFFTEFPLFILSMIFMFPSTGGIRNRFPFLVGVNKFLWLEKAFWFLSVVTYALGIYFNSWKWNYLGYIIPSFIFATVYTWYVRTIEANAYKKNEKLKRGVEPGDKAIEFELPDQNGNIVKSKDFYGKTDVLLLFVRGDWCPACHIMLRTYYKYREKFKEKGVFFIAIGPDPQGVNKEMLERIGADFIILSDEGLKITNQYGVQGDGQIPNNDFEGIPLPAAFIIDKSGIIRYTTRPESPGSFLRPDSILTVLDGLKVEISHETFEETYETIVNQSNDGILVLDIVEGKILKNNLYFANLLGYSENDFLKKNIFDFTPQEFLNESAKLIADAWENKGAIFRMQFLSSNQEIIPTECSAKVIPYGKFSALVLYVRDIRERIKMETQILKQSQIIEQKNRDILDSIEYAKRIQTATLPNEKKDWLSFAKQAFIYFEPKDIVSGDFYWLNFDEEDNRIFFALGDCTGHGVPGAFMSMLAINQLNHIIDDLKIKEPLKIIENLDLNIQKALKQEEGGNDGLDCALFMYEKNIRKLQFVLAGRPLYYSLNNQPFVEIKGDKFPIGGTLHKSKSFNQHEIEIGNQSLKLLIYSDGIVDQMGGERKKKFGTKNLKQFFENQGLENLNETFSKLSITLNNWKDGHEQLDDMTLILMEL